MARPVKNGLDYFPLDCTSDTKLELLEAEFGLNGFAIVVKLLQKIYGEQGYYCEWTNEVALLFARKNGAGGNAVSEIVNAAIKRGIFDKGIFNKYHVLTSADIQERYLEAVNRRKRVEMISEYLLIKVAQNSENVYINSINVDINSKNVCNNPQSKVKESKVKKRKEKESKAAEPPQCEEKNTSDKFHAAKTEPYSESTADCASQASLNARPQADFSPPSSPQGKTYFQLPAADGEYALTAEFYENLSEAYPKTDIDECLKAIKIWLTANPSKRKLSCSMDRFVSNWIKGDAEKGKHKKYESSASYDINEYENSDILDSLSPADIKGLAKKK